MKSIPSIVLLAAFCCTYIELSVAGSVNADAEANAEADADDGDNDDGDEECPTICPQVELPVCGLLRIQGQTIYQTFGNSCKLGVQNCLYPDEPYRQVSGENKSCESLQRYSRCRSTCTKEYNPICGARYNKNGVRVYETFGNPCEFWSTVCLKPNLRWEKYSDDEC